MRCEVCGRDLPATEFNEQGVCDSCRRGLDDDEPGDDEMED